MIFNLLGVMRKRKKGIVWEKFYPALYPCKRGHFRLPKNLIFSDSKLAQNEKYYF